MPEPVPVVYVSDLTFVSFEPSDLFDLAYLVRSPAHRLQAVCLASESGDGERVIEAFTQAARLPYGTVQTVQGASLAELLQSVSEPVNLVVAGGYSAVASVLEVDRALFRAKVARVFLVGGHINEYDGESKERIPTDPRLRSLHPDRFESGADKRVKIQQSSFARLLTSGEGVIWLPRDICLWRYSAPGVLADGGTLCEFLLRELFWANTQTMPDRYDAAEAPALLSTLPGLLLATEPDPFAWMRLFRVLPARVYVNEAGQVTTFATQTDRPNVYAVIALDGQALGKVLTAALRERPLV